MSAITTHVLDTAHGKPASGVPIELDHRGKDGAWTRLGAGVTDADGRLKTLLPAGHALEAGTYALRFDIAAYHHGRGFFPEVRIVFAITDPKQHHHVPLLLSPFGYSTYRGS